MRGNVKAAATLSLLLALAGCRETSARATDEAPAAARTGPAPAPAGPAPARAEPALAGPAAARPAQAPPAPAPASASAAAPHIVYAKRHCMGTECEITAWVSDEDKAHAAFGRAFDELDRIEALMSTWRATSTVSKINAAAGGAPVAVDPDTMAVLKRSLWVAKITDGAFDITFGAMKGLWKFDEDNDGSLPDPRAVAERLKLVNWHDLVVDEKKMTARLRRKGQAINLGGIAKGYAVDAAVKAVREAGVRDFIVKAGGDLFASGRRGDRDWNVGIQDPRGPLVCPVEKAMDCIIGKLAISDRAFSTSGDYERFIMKDGKRYHHIIDPKTGYPANKARAVTLLAKDAFTADALDTAILILGPEAGMKLIEDLPDVEGVIVGADNKVHLSSGLQKTLQIVRPPTDGP